MLTCNFQGRLTRNVTDLKSYDGSISFVTTIAIRLKRVKKLDDTFGEAVLFASLFFYGNRFKNLKSYLIKGKPIVVSGTIDSIRQKEEGYTGVEVCISVSSCEFSMGTNKTENNNGTVSNGFYSDTDADADQHPIPRKEKADEDADLQGDRKNDV